MRSSPVVAGDLGGLSRWAPELAEALVRLSSDIALVLRPDGVIEKVVQSGLNPISAEAGEWVGRPFSETVSGESREKIEHLLKEVADTGVGRRREVNHPGAPGAGIPVAYTAIRLGDQGPYLAVGRDLRAVAAIQQRFLEVQRDTEQAYWKARQADARYQLLFQVASDGMLLVDGDTLRVLEANRAAAQLLGVPGHTLPGQEVSAGFDLHSRELLEELLAEARTSGRHSEMRARLAGSSRHANVAITPFRLQASLRLLVRVRLEHRLELARPSAPRAVARAEEAVVVTDSQGRVVTANHTFLTLVRAASEDQLRGRSLAEWLRVEPGLEALVARVRSQGLVQQADARLGPAGARAAPVQLSASLLTEDDQERLGFTLYPTPAALAAPGELEALPTGLDGAVAGLLGTGTLVELVSRAAGLVERQLLVMAVDRTGGNLDASAKLLGIERADLERRLQQGALSPGQQPGEPPR